MEDTELSSRNQGNVQGNERSLIPLTIDKILGLSDINAPTPILSNNQGSIDWVESKGIATKKLRHENTNEFKIAEARFHNEINILWIPGKKNPADIFTKKDKDVGHYEGL